jgi:hypothetical protein
VDEDRLAYNLDMKSGSTFNSLDVKKEIEALRRATRKICRTKESARKFLVDHGYHTPDGKLTKRYGGTG